MPLMAGSNLTGTFQQNDDPGAVGAGRIWSDTNDQVTYRRTDDNTQWVPIGAKVGDILMWGGNEADVPSGFVVCDGAAISRTTFLLLFNLIGTTYGIGDGSTTFNVPDLQTANRFPRAATNDAALGDTGGESTHALSEGELATHSHGVTPNPHGHNEGAFSGGSSAGVGYDEMINQAGTQRACTTTSLTIDNTGSGTAHENKPPFIDVHYIISTGIA